MVQLAQGYLVISTDFDSINVTPRHPFYAGADVTDKAAQPGFREIGAFKVGDAIFLESLSGLFRDSVTDIQRIEERVPVYNLHLRNGPPTYFANGFAVHNY
jgi:hypothetical protein